MKRELTCIICPRGCALTADITKNGVAVAGNACPRGAEYAVSECLHPMRTVTATVRISNRRNTMVSVKTENPVPRERMMDIMAQLRQIRIPAPVSIGDVVLEDVCGTRVIVTKEIP